MFKTKQKISSVIVACLTMFVSVLLAVMTLVMPSKANVTASAATTEIVFELGSNGSAGHKDGSAAKETYTETVGAYTLNLTGGQKMYPSSYDAKGNSCIKLGSSSAVGGFSFTVPDDVTSVIIAVAKYKTNASKISVNGTAYTLTKNSNDGAYDEITVDTSATKTVSFTTVSGGVRAMVNTITYVIESSEPTCEHANTTETTTDATCTVAGSTVVTCNDCGETVSTTEIPATGHQNQTTTTTDATCTEAGSIVVTCDDCGETVSSETIDALGHSIENSEPVNNENGTHSITGVCATCGEEETVTDDCTFERAETEPTYTCTECGYSYSVNEYTVTYSVPANIAAIDAVKVEENEKTTLKSAEDYDEYTFVGWMLTELQSTTEKPEIIEAGTEYTVTADVTLYAVYTYSEGSSDWTLVTDVNTLSIGNQIVIVASASNSALGTTQNTNNRAAVAITKGTDTVKITDEVQIITLEAGTVADTFAFNVGSGYLYAASSSANQLKTQLTNNANGSWTIEITSTGVATIKAQGTYTRNLLRKNSSSALFACYSSGQHDVSIYKKDGNTFYTTSFGGCAHAETTEETTEPTCTETGLTKVVCNACKAVVSETEIPALDHKYVDNFCSRCGEQDPETIDYTGYYYISFTHGETVYYADNSQLSSNRYYARTEAPSVETVETKYVYRLVKTAVGIYALYEFDGDLYQDDITVEKVDGVYRFYATTADGACQFLLNAGNATKYIKFYKASNATQSNYAQDITLTPVELSANIDEATITLGDDITLNYYVTMSAAYEGAIMQFKVGESSDLIEVEGVLVGERYKFSLNVPPHYMTTNVKAVLVFGELELDRIENYSIQTYAQNQLNKNPNETLKQLLIDLLYYGAAAQNYKAFNTENLANAGIENSNDVAPATTDFTLVKNTEIDSYPAYFLGAGVYFDNVNKIFIKLNTTENVTLTINGVEAEITGTTIYTEGILATGFAETYTFVLSCNGVVMQTLTYSVNAYAYAKQNDAMMGELALALYRYGESAKAYKA